MKHKVKFINWCRIADLLNYDPLTGILTNKIDRGRARQGLIPGHYDGISGYLIIKIDDICYYGHRLAWAIYYQENPPLMLDHIDGDKVNNRITNLRFANHTINGKNQKLSTKNRTGYMGVSYAGYGEKAIATIRANGQDIHLGTFDTLQDAHLAYQEAANDAGFHNNHGRVV